MIRPQEGKIIIAMIFMFGVIQIMQLNYSYLRHSPYQCDCQCTKQLRISSHQLVAKEGDNVQSSEMVSLRPSKVNLQSKVNEDKNEEEENRQRILAADDNVLNKKMAANKSKNIKDVTEKPEEEIPYQKEELDKQVRRNETLIPAPLDINPMINASGFQCNENESDLLLIYTYTAPGNFEQRKRVRRTYGSVSKVDNNRVKVLFFIGELNWDNKTKELYGKLVNESIKYGDLVQDRSYFDAYKNLTLKGISALKWISKYCPNTYSVMKVDDDTIINPYTLVRFLQGQSDITMSKVICKLTEGKGPNRNPRSKYYISVAEYSDDYYPTYCQGYGYIFPSRVLLELVKGFEKNRPIVMEDVFITGLTSKAMDINLHSLTSEFATGFSGYNQFLERITTNPELLMVAHAHGNRYFDVFWRLVQRRETARREEETEEREVKEQQEKEEDDNDIINRNIQKFNRRAIFH